jgi:hypothetical protein
VLATLDILVLIVLSFHVMDLIPLAHQFALNMDSVSAPTCALAPVVILVIHAMFQFAMERIVQVKMCAPVLVLV